MKPKIKKLTWDEALPRHLENEFREWMNELKDIIGYKVQRYIVGKTKNRFESPQAKDEMEVHVYCDGGGDSFGAVAFLR